MFRVIKLVIILCVITSVSSKTKNVLFVIIDDLKPLLGCYGDSNAYTPNINKLAEKSFLFTNVYAQQALCAPSRNSLLTSRRPDTLRLYDFYSYWRDFAGNFTTLPQYFKENGYYTYSVGKVFHPGVSSNFSDDFPFSWTVPAFHPKTETFMNAKVCRDIDGGFAANLICPVLVEEQPDGTLPDFETLEAAKSYLKHRKNDKPFFLAVGFHKPHIPFKFPIQYLDFHPIENVKLPINKNRPSSLPIVAWNPWNDVRWRHDVQKLNVFFPFGPIPDDFIKKIIQNYRASTTYIDDLVGKLLENVKNDTIVILTADHGWSLGEHGEFSKYSNFEEVTKVPLLIHVPNLSRKKIVLNQLVELVDIFPTLVDLTQVSYQLPRCPKHSNGIKLCTEGDSLVKVMVRAAQGKETKGKSAVFSQYPRPGTQPTLTPNSDKPRLRDIKIMGYSVKTTRYRYSEWIGFNSDRFVSDWNRTYGRELYDHLIDPKENMNLADRSELKEIMGELRKVLINGWSNI